MVCQIRSNFAILRSRFASLADQLKRALDTDTESGDQGNPTFDTAGAAFPPTILQAA